MVNAWTEFPEFFTDPAELIAVADFYSDPPPGVANDFVDFHRHWTAAEILSTGQIVYQRRTPRRWKAPKS